MADQLQSIVQRMIDAGESEDNIASVIREYKSRSPEAPAMLPGGVRRYAMESATVKDETPTQPSPLLQMLQSPAHPQTLGEMASLAIPSALPTRWVRGMIHGAGDVVSSATPGFAKPLVGRLRQLIGQGPLLEIKGTQPPIDRYAPSTSGYQSGSALAEGASAMEAPAQATFTQLPNGSWGLVGSGLRSGERANVITRAGAGQMVHVGEIISDENGIQRATIGKPPVPSAPVPMLPQNRSLTDPEALKQEIFDKFMRSQYGSRE